MRFTIACIESTRKQLLQANRQLDF
uniref:Uncharacterized protein n=1 Tax=Arundo donax TaxID=35708 RepID=A0A0A8YNQ0_ARUDO